MQELNFPYFKKDRILKIEMLEIMRDYPRDVLDVCTENLSDGIISGLMPKVDKQIITFSKGLVKHKGKIYVIGKPTILSYGATEDEVSIKMNFYDEISDKDYRTQYIEIEIEPYTEITENQLELGRFKLKKGAYLRSEYQDLYDFTTEYNTINIVNVLYSGYKQPTLSNIILKYFARETLQTRTQNQMDITFCLLCLNNERIEREVIQNYIAYKLEEEINPVSNFTIHTKLVKILEKIKKENSGLKKKIQFGQKIILD